VLIAYGEYWYAWFLRRLAERTGECVAIAAEFDGQLRPIARMVKSKYKKKLSI